MRPTAWLLLLALGPALAGTIGVDELRPGMTGYGLSVFDASGIIDTFRVELVDVMRNTSPGGDMILCRLAGQGLEHSGIVAGMSGSPVYFDGRLAGALAYGWSFSKDPLGGVTPIAEMLAVLREPDAPAGRSPRSSIAHPQSAIRSQPLTIPLPLGISGSAPGLLRLAGSLLDGSGLVPVAAGRADAGRAGAPGFRPGSPVGVLLADGDVRYAATGTVTWVEGDRLLAFGHPMFQAGAVALPMSGADVHAVVPSYASSFKLASTGPPVGTIRQDRLPAVSGVVGPVPPMLPVRVRLDRPGFRREYNFRLAEFPPLLPVFAALGVAEVVYATEGGAEEMTLEARVRVKPAGRPGVAFRHVFTGLAPADLLARSVMEKLALLTDNRFEPVRLESLDFALELRPGRRRVTVTGVLPGRTTVVPGDSLPLYLELRDQDGRVSSRRVTVRIPAAAPAGRLTLSVSSADTFLLRESYRAPGTVEPAGLDALLRLLGRVGDEDVLVIAGYSGAPGLSVGGKELPAPPPTLRRLLGSGRRGRQVGESRLFADRLPLGAVVAGSHEIVLEVRK
ncbi:MAG: hypothetical protein R6X14_02420 [bacterium]